MADPATFHHIPSDRYYRIEKGRMQRYQVDPRTGEEIHKLSRSIDLAIGSGNHATTYIHRTAQGRLIELPLSWYSRTHGWQMSPGYDRADHEDFRREISDTCLFCHSGSPNPSPIGCHRCHGPTAQHLQSPIRGSVLNPARLPSNRQLDVCLQCHLQTSSAGLQDSVRRPGMSTWGFQPGMLLGEYKMLFARENVPATRLEINSSAYRLMQSACFLKSKGKMLCTSCHDPHTGKVKTNACRKCHSNAHSREARIEQQSCESCHMPKRNPVDAIHTRITDHRIATRPPTSDATEEDHTPYRGKAVPFYTDADPFTLAAVNRSDDPSIYRKLGERDSNNVSLLAMLGKVLLRRQYPSSAASILERAVSLNPACTDCLAHLAVANALRGNLQQALKILQNAVSDNPDHVLSWTNLGITYEALGNVQAANRAYTEALLIQPDSREAQQRKKRLKLK